MPSAHVFIATSLDGYIARTDGDIAWLTEVPVESGVDYGYGAFIATIDGLIMGRASFEVVQQFDPWPYDRPVIVLSRTLGDQAIPEALQGRVSIARSIPEAMDDAGRRGWTRVYVDGGQVVTAFLAAGLVDDIVLTRIPILIGSGLALFGPLRRDIEFEHLETRSWANGFVQSRYRVRRD